MSNYFSDSMKIWYRSHFGTAQNHSAGKADGYRDTQDDAINEMNKTHDGVADSNPLTNYGAMGGQALVAGISAYTTALQQERKYQAQASEYQSQVATANTNVATARNNMYNAYQMGAYKAMLTGLTNGQKIANVRAQNAQSGVRMGTGSKAEVESSQRLMKEVDRITQQQNTTSAAMREYVNAANYKAQGIIAQGNADAANIMAGGISPFLSGLSSVSGSLAKSLWVSAGGINPFLSSLASAS